MITHLRLFIIFSIFLFPFESTYAQNCCGNEINLVEGYHEYDISNNRCFKLEIKDTSWVYLEIIDIDFDSGVKYWFSCDNVESSPMNLGTWLKARRQSPITYYFYAQEADSGRFAFDVQIVSLEDVERCDNQLVNMGISYSECSDPLSCNYDSSSENYEIEDCYYLGCTNSLASNFDGQATIDDGSCILDVYGCKDPDSNNYNPQVLSDDGSCTFTQTIHIPKGWSLISFNTFPDDGKLNVCDVFSEVIEDIDMIVDFGGSFVYWQGLCNRDINFNEGWKVHAHNDCTITITGTAADIENVTINAQTGWNYIPYLRRDSISVQSFVDNVIRIHDDKGNVYIPGVFDGIGKLIPGKSYMAKFEESYSFTYDTLNKVTTSELSVTDTSPFYQSNFTINSDEYATFLVSEQSWVNSPPENADLAAFSSDGTLYGVSKITLPYTAIAVPMRKDFTGTSGLDSWENIHFKIITEFDEYDVESQIDLVANSKSLLELPENSLGWSDNSGCTDPNADNFESDATQDDGLCTYNDFGCTDETALNFDEEATNDDDSCLYQGSEITTIRVPADFSSIQEAIDVAHNGDTVMVSSGTYYVNNLYINKDILLIGEDQENQPILDGEGTNRILTIESPGIDTLKVSNFTIQNGHALGRSGGVIVFPNGNDYSLAIFENLSIQNSGGGTGNVLFEGSGIGKTFYIDCVVRNNSAENYAGISGSTVIRTILYGNSGWNNTAVLAGCDSYNCTVYNNSGGAMFNPWTVGGMSGGTATNCIFWNNAGHNGQQIYSAESVTYSLVQGGCPGEGNIDSNPQFVNEEIGDFSLQDGSPCIDAGAPSSPQDPDFTTADIGAVYKSQLNTETFENTCNYDEYPTGLISGLSHFYSFCENTEDLVSGINGITHGTQYTSGRLGENNGAVSFDGDVYIELTNTFYQGAEMNELTYNVWFNIPQLPSLGSYVISGKEGYWKTIRMSIGTGGQISFGGSSSNTYFSVTSDENAFSLGDWHMISVTLLDNVLKLYLNGELIAENESQASLLQYQLHAAGNSTATNYFGAIHPVSTGITNYFTGYLDEFALWERALTQVEISQLFNIIETNSQVIIGCKDELACNYNKTATDPGECVYAIDLDECASCSGEQDGTGVVVDNDADDDGVCDADEIVGCEDETACNYNQNATDSDDCVYAQVTSYVPDEIVFECFLDFTSSSSCASPYLDAGNYILELSGTWCGGSCWGGNHSDAAFNINPDPVPIRPPWTWNEYCPQDDNTCETYRPIVDEHNDQNTYHYPFTSDGGVETIYGISDECCWWDNSGGLSVKIFRDYSTEADACTSCSGETDGTGVVVDNDVDDDGVCDADEIVGCEDETACNYNQAATDPGECVYAIDLDECASCSGEQDGTGIIVDNDADDDGVCDADEIAGCTYLTADNYDTNATDDDGSCIIRGCTDANVCNYNADATLDEGCLPALDGVCETCSIDAQGNVFTGTGVVVDNDSDNDGICDEDEILGCEDETACNYNELATDDDGSCLIPQGCDSCLESAIIDNDADDDGVCDADEIVGCQDETACNYNENATDSFDSSSLDCANHWVKLMSSAEIPSSIRLEEAAYDKENNRLYTVDHESETFGVFDFSESNWSELPSSGWFGRMDEFVFNKNANTILGWRSGVDRVYSIPAVGGEWEVYSSGSHDSNHYGGAEYFNPITGMPGFIGGYGYWTTHNQVFEVEQSSLNWKEIRGDSNDGNPPRAIFGYTTTNKEGDILYLFNGHGNYNGQQSQHPLTYNDGNYDLTRGLWALDLNTYNFSTIVPLDNNSIMQNGPITFNYNDSTFYVIGARIFNDQMSFTSEAEITNKIFKFNPLLDEEFVEYAEFDGESFPVSEDSGIALYDSSYDRLVFVRKDGVWALSLSCDSDINPTLSCVSIDPTDPCAGCSGEQDGTGIIVDNDADDDGICDADEIVGCEDELACNYNENATDDSGNCSYLESNSSTESAWVENFDSGLDNWTNYGGGSISTSSNSYEGQSVYLTHYAGETPNNFSPNNITVSYGDYLLYAMTPHGISDLNIKLFQPAQSTDGGLSISICPSNGDSPVIRMSGLGVNEESSPNFSVGEWVKIDIHVEPSYISLSVKDELILESYDLENVPEGGTIKLQGVYKAHFDEISYLPVVQNSSCESCSGETDGTGTIVDNDADDDGVCDADEIVGCEDETACNYNHAATDPGECVYAIDLDVCASCSGEQDGTGIIVDNDADDDGVCDADEIVGCEDETACNYNHAATDPGECVYAIDLDVCASCSGEQDGTGIIVDNDADDDGVCDADEIVGCEDEIACNYNHAATDPGECVYAIDLDVCASCSGEQDGTGIIVDNDADDDGVCDADEIFPIYQNLNMQVNNIVSLGDIVYYSGTFSDSLSLGAETLFADSSSDIFIVKVHNEEVIWSRRLSGSSLWSNSLEVSNNSVFLGGGYGSTMIYHGSESTTTINHTGGSDGFVVRIDADGEYIWHTNVLGGSNEGVMDVASDENGNVYISGHYNGCCPSTFNATISSSSGSSLSLDAPSGYFNSGFVCKLDSDGNPIWAIESWARDIVVSNIEVVDDYLYLSGNFRTWSSGESAYITDVDGNYNSIYNPGIGLSFLAQYSTDGKHNWDISIGNQGNGVNQTTTINDLVVSDSGMPILCGTYSGGVSNFHSTDSNTLSVDESVDLNGFVAQYNEHGIPIWVNTYSTAGDNIPNSLETKDNGDILIGGYYFDDLNDLSSMGSSDIFIMELDESGEEISVTSYGSTGEDILNDIVYHAGSYSFSGTASYGLEINKMSLDQGGFVYIPQFEQEICSYTPPWQVTMTDQNHSIFINGQWFGLNGELISEGSMVGVFYTSDSGELVCSGYTEIGDGTIKISAMGDDSQTEAIDGLTPGQKFMFLIWDASNCEVSSVNVEYTNGPQVYTSNGITFIDNIYASPSGPTEQLLILPTGWSMFSTYIHPENLAFDALLSEVVDDVIIAKDYSGAAYLPEFNFNGIGDIKVGYGYQVKMSKNNQLLVSGNYTTPSDNPILLPEGWFMLGYLREEPAPVDMVFADIISDIIIVKDYLGKAYLPEFNFNGIGDLQPGQGYQLKVQHADTLRYLSNNTQYRLSSSNVIKNHPKHLMQVRPTDQNMTVVIEDEVWSEVPSEGSEIGVFNQEGLMVGSGQYTSPVSVMSVYGNDVLSDAKDGMLSKEPMIFKLWNDNSLQEMKIPDWKSGSSIYQKDAIHVVGSVITNSEVEIITPIKRSLVKIVNVLGQEVSPQETLLKGIVYFEIYDDGSVEKRLNK